MKPLTSRNFPYLPEEYHTVWEGKILTDKNICIIGGGVRISLGIDDWIRDFDVVVVDGRKDAEAKAKEWFEVLSKVNPDNVKLMPLKEGWTPNIFTKKNGAWNQLTDIYNWGGGEGDLPKMDKFYGWGYEIRYDRLVVGGQHFRNPPEEGMALSAAVMIPVGIGQPTTPTEVALFDGQLRDEYIRRGGRFEPKADRLKDVVNFVLLQRKLIDIAVESGQSTGVSGRENLARFEAASIEKFMGVTDKAGYTFRGFVSNRKFPFKG